jgi:CRP-like cAMP-binding protein
LAKVTGMITKIWPALRRLLRSPFTPLRTMTLADTGVGSAELVAAVRKTELFCNAELTLVQAMLEQMQVRPVRQGDMILRQGVRSDRFVLLAAGRAEVTRLRDGGRVARSLAVLTEPSGLGEEALLGAESRNVTATMLTDGIILEIRRADFARLISERGVQWLTPDVAEVKPPAAWLWTGSAKTRPRGMGMGAEALVVELERLRERLSELDPARHYLCCGKEDGNSALAAFLLTQRGFTASAVHDGRRAVVRV